MDDNFDNETFSANDFTGKVERDFDDIKSDNNNLSTFTSRTSYSETGAETLRQRLDTNELLWKIELFLMSVKEVEYFETINGRKVSRKRLERIKLGTTKDGKKVYAKPLCSEYGRMRLMQKLTSLVNKDTALSFTTIGNGEDGLSFNIFLKSLHRHFRRYIISYREQLGISVSNLSFIINSTLDMVDLHLSKTIGGKTAEQISGGQTVTESVTPVGEKKKGMIKSFNEWLNS